jgi:hydrogenase/urease accessory protein HupE
MKLVTTVGIASHIILMGCWIYVVFTYDLPLEVSLLAAIAWLGIGFAYGSRT